MLSFEFWLLKKCCSKSNKIITLLVLIIKRIVPTQMTKFYLYLCIHQFLGPFDLFSSGRPISFFSYRPIPTEADKFNFLIGRYR